MKKIILSVLLISLFPRYQAQIVFCPPGALWHYNFYFMTVNFQLQQYVKIDFNVPVKYERDSLLGSKQVKVLSHEYFFEGTCYSYNSPRITLLHQSGDTIFFRNKSTKHKWQILYNFAATAGQQWTDSLYGDSNNLLRYLVKVDSTTIVNVNGFNLKRLYVKYNSEPSVITERFGTNSFLFHFATPSCDGPSDFELFLCYQDSAFSSKQFSSRPCNYSTALYAGINETSEIDFLDFFPNPVSNFLTIDLKNAFSMVDAHIRITNLLGQTLLNIKPEKSQQQIDLSFLQNGLYFLELHDAENVILKRKIVKTN